MWAELAIFRGSFFKKCLYGSAVHYSEILLLHAIEKQQVGFVAHPENLGEETNLLIDSALHIGLHSFLLDVQQLKGQWEASTVSFFVSN